MVVSTPESPRPSVADVVPTFANVLAPEKYGMLPTTAGEEVPRPRNENAPEELL